MLVQVAQDSGIPEIPRVVMGFCDCQDIPEKTGNVTGFFSSRLVKFLS